MSSSTCVCVPCFFGLYVRAAGPTFTNTAGGYIPFFLVAVLMEILLLCRLMHHRCSSIYIYHSVKQKQAHTCSLILAFGVSHPPAHPQMRSTLGKLEQALERERARNKRDLASAKKAAMEAKEAAKAKVVEAAAAAEVEALNAGGVGGGSRGRYVRV